MKKKTGKQLSNIGKGIGLRKGAKREKAKEIGMGTWVVGLVEKENTFS